MNTSSDPSAAVDQDIAERVARAGLRLRFDRVAVRVVGSLRNRLTDAVPEGEAWLIAITAPIRQPAKTVGRLEALARSGRSAEAVFGNGVRLRRIVGVAAHPPRVFGFVHNREVDAEALFDQAEARLRNPG